ncbi:hypothetical protein LCGC14_2692870, partial [marine sediment metagenome]
PGASGGIAWFDSVGVAHAVKMPVTDRDILNVLQPLARGTCSSAALEKVSASQGRNPDGSMRIQGVASAFKFGMGYGGLRMALTACEIPFDDVMPKKWQAEFGLLRLSKAETITEKKNRHKAKAQQLFPLLTITHAIADALLIAEWLRRRELGKASDD